MLLFITLLSLGNTWKVDWESNQLNKELQIVYTCQKDADHPVFIAINQWDIEPEDTKAIVRAVPTPKGQLCQVTASIIQAIYNMEWVSEYILIYKTDP